MDNTYLNSIITNLSGDITTINEKIDCIGTTHQKYDSLFSGKAWLHKVFRQCFPGEKSFKRWIDDFFKKQGI